ncbi:MAG: hypothetical protein ACRDHX_06155 [Chloroflexota bacterium]
MRLTWARPELLRRVQNPDRLEQQKLTDPDVLLGLLDTLFLPNPLPFEPTITIDSTFLVPAEVASQIIEHYALPVRAGEG